MVVELAYWCMREGIEGFLRFALANFFNCVGVSTLLSGSFLFELADLMREPLFMSWLTPGPAFTTF